MGWLFKVVDIEAPAKTIYVFSSNSMNPVRHGDGFKTAASVILQKTRLAFQNPGYP
jgi:hypothetical protein